MSKKSRLSPRINAWLNKPRSAREMRIILACAGIVLALLLTAALVLTLSGGSSSNPFPQWQPV